MSPLYYALLAAVFASLVPILSKSGMQGIDSTLATALRSIVMTAFLLITCSAAGLWSRLPALSARPIALILLTGVAGALSWLCYFKAIQDGTAWQPASIDKLSLPLAVILAVVFLQERPGQWNWLGIALMSIGAALTALPK